jgi:hypothetical protein
VDETVTKAGGHKHVMNLGHGTSRSERYITTLLLARALHHSIAALHELTRPLLPHFQA